MEPCVILHTATSLDGRITNFPADLELYYSLAARWNPDAILLGSSTILTAPSLEVPPEHREMFEPKETREHDPRPLMVVVDSKGKIRCWDLLKTWPYMRDLVVFCSAATPEEYLDYVKEQQIGTIIAGEDQVDMRAALEELHRQYGVRIVRADCGGTLNSVLLKTGLVREVSVLIHPFLAGGAPDATMFDPHRAGISGLQIPLRHLATEMLANGIVWVRYAPAGPSR